MLRRSPSSRSYLCSTCTLRCAFPFHAVGVAIFLRAFVFSMYIRVRLLLHITYLGVAHLRACICVVYVHQCGASLSPCCANNCVFACAFGLPLAWPALRVYLCLTSTLRPAAACVMYMRYITAAHVMSCSTSHMNTCGTSHEAQGKLFPAQSLIDVQPVLTSLCQLCTHTRHF